MTQQIRPVDRGATSTSHDDQGSQHLGRRIAVAAAAVVVAGSALTVGLQAAAPDTTGPATPAVPGGRSHDSQVPAPSRTAQNRGDDDERDDEATNAGLRTSRVRAVTTPVPVVAVSGGSGG